FPAPCILVKARPAGRRVAPVAAAAASAIAASVGAIPVVAPSIAGGRLVPVERDQGFRLERVGERVLRDLFRQRGRRIGFDRDAAFRLHLDGGRLGRGQDQRSLVAATGEGQRQRDQQQCEGGFHRRSVSRRPW